MMAHRHLDTRLTPNIEYTRRDEITFSLIDAIKCPISLEITDQMILFNNQFYDRQNFDSHRGAETRLNQVRVGEVIFGKMRYV